MPAPAKKAKKPWAGEKRGGPAPARHIPWPEIFKHHISVVEGHSKMLEMVQKHTTPGTGNYTTISTMLERGHEILRQSKDMARSFMPPKGQREQVPLGSSSASMYPGYSIKEIVYGEASQEVGHAVGNSRARGEDWQPPHGLEYEVGQAHGPKKKLYMQKGTATDEPEGPAVNNADAAGQHESDEAAGAPQTNGDGAYFVIDTEPMTVDLGNGAAPNGVGGGRADEKKERKERRTKRRASPGGAAAEDESEEPPKKKNRKKRSKEEAGNGTEAETGLNGGTVTAAAAAAAVVPAVETEDISEEVDARLRAKEKKRRLRAEAKAGKKEEEEEEEEEEQEEEAAGKSKSKRRRESEGGEEEGQKVAKKPKKEKSGGKKKERDETSNEGEGGGEEWARKERKKRRKGGDE